MTPAPDRLLAMYAGMLRVRLFEERVRELFAGGRIPGFLHTSVGQEAVAVGVCAALRPDDYVLSTRSEEHTSELQSRGHLVCRLLLEKKNTAAPFPPGRGQERTGPACGHRPSV